MTSDRVIVDTNVLVYAFTSTAPLHNEARAALSQLEEQRAELWISRQIIREYIREYIATLTRPQSFDIPDGIDAVIGQVSIIQDSFNVADGTTEVTTHLLDLLLQHSTGGKQVHDANVEATMLAYGIDRLLTHNVGDFRRFASKITLIPLVSEAG